MEGVLITADTGKGILSTVSNEYGYYGFTGLREGENILTASKEGYDFEPASITVTVPPDGQFGFIFYGKPKGGPTPEPTTYRVEGKVLGAGGTPVTGVTVTIGGRSTTTDSSGSYSLEQLPVGSYTVKPTMQGCIFEPVNQTVNLPPTASNVDFTCNTTPVDEPLKVFLPIVTRNEP
jgi:hypothetical protein